MKRTIIGRPSKQGEQSMNLLGMMACLFIGHPIPRWAGPGWISTARRCQRCGLSQFYIANPDAHEAQLADLRLRLNGIDK
jgi:hypothetical protein